MDAVFLQLDLPALVAAILASVLCALLGNQLVLRRQGMMADALSHAVVPGIVASFLLFARLNILTIFLGALAAAALAAVLIDWIQRHGRIEPGASMGVVFTIMFASGLLLISLYNAGDVHLEPEHILFGQLELVFWVELTRLSDLLTIEVWRAMPGELVLLAVCLSVAVLYTRLFGKELQLVAFDAEFARSGGVATAWLNHSLMIVVAAGCIVAFLVAGTILVVGMMICPPATARLLTDDYRQQARLSIVIGLLTAIAGYVAGALLPLWLGYDLSFSAAGMIAVTGGLVFLLVALRWRGHAVLPGSADRREH